MTDVQAAKDRLLSGLTYLDSDAWDLAVIVCADHDQLKLERDEYRDIIGGDGKVAANAIDRLDEYKQQLDEQAATIERMRVEIETHTASALASKEYWRQHRQADQARIAALETDKRGDQNIIHTLVEQRDKAEEARDAAAEKVLTFQTITVPRLEQERDEARRMAMDMNNAHTSLGNQCDAARDLLRRVEQDLSTLVLCMRQAAPGAFSNGNTDPSGSMDEGEVLTGRVVERAEQDAAEIRRVLEGGK